MKAKIEITEDGLKDAVEEIFLEVERKKRKRRQRVRQLED